MIAQGLPNSPLTDEFLFSNEQLLSMGEIANVIACECPARLVGLLWEARKFYHYTIDCINRFPEDAETHHWLGQNILEIDTLVSQVLLELMQRENLLDAQQQVNLEALKERQLQAISSHLDLLHSKPE